MTSSPCESSHASATCPAVALYSLPIFWSSSTNFKIFGKFSFEYLHADQEEHASVSKIFGWRCWRTNLGTFRLKSPSSKSSGDFYQMIQSVSESGY